MTETYDFIPPVVSASEANDMAELARVLEAWEAAEPRSPVKEENNYPLGPFPACIEPSTRAGKYRSSRFSLEAGSAHIAQYVLAGASAGTLTALENGCNEASDWNTKPFDVLLENGWYPDWRFGHMGDALIRPVSTRKLPLVKYLLDKGADPNRNLTLNRSPLELACVHADTEILSLLIAHGAETKDRSGLLLAAKEGKTDMIDVLLDAGAEIDALPNNRRVTERVEAEDDWGTALHGAVERNQVQCVQHLLAKGARRDVKNAVGLTPLELAEKKGLTECAELLAE
ncbi:Uu.00g112560.m01.CDS01 [Anthostomella pinea]|uniref:Uu.00g112560.m01.CDS01 n=1 Tax=Anthostomella pinea TaxID=933095 RepID=A0AAI8VA50_9PEZI|nr:Uu.00g112560.m01.CDS01 [Anthostomella pinea]